MNRYVKSLVILAASVIAAWPTAVPAHETDQFSNRTDPIADSTEVLNYKMNKAIAHVARKQRLDDDRMAIVNALFGKLGSQLLVDKIVANCGVHRPEATVETLRVKRKKVAELGLRRDEWVGCAILFCNTDVKRFFQLIPPERQDARFYGFVRALRPAYYQATVDVAFRVD